MDQDMGSNRGNTCDRTSTGSSTTSPWGVTPPGRAFHLPQQQDPTQTRAWIISPHVFSPQIDLLSVSPISPISYDR